MKLLPTGRGDKGGAVGRDGMKGSACVRAWGARDCYRVFGLRRAHEMRMDSGRKAGWRWRW